MAVQIPTVWSDLDHRLIQDSLGTLKKVTNVASVMSSIDNILRTYKMERVMLPQFAGNFRSMLFEGMTETMLKFISRDMREMLETWDDRIKIMEISLISDPDSSSVSINLDFAIRGWGDIFKYETTIRDN